MTHISSSEFANFTNLYTERYREPNREFSELQHCMGEFVYKEISSSSFKDSASEKIDLCEKVIRSHLQSNSCWHHIFLL
jgi:hypothetical protein